jgi:hypothetical protein
LGLYYIYTWNYHKKTSQVTTFISNKQKCNFSVFLFYKIGEQESRTCPGGVEEWGWGRGGWHQWEGGNGVEG